MKIIKELPDIFEEFAEQRKKSFLEMKELKDKGVPVGEAVQKEFIKMRDELGLTQFTFPFE